MEVIFGLENVPSDGRASAVAVGVFDGVHWGHRAIFQRLNDVATQNGLQSVALTFDKHPAELLAPTRAPLYISTLEQRIELIRGVSIDRVVIAEFNHELANISADDFIKVILSKTLHAKHIAVGSNFRFGKGRDGDIRYLQTIGPSLGLGVTIVPSVIISGGPASSTRVRAMVERGDVTDAAKLLGRRFTLRGTVVTGRQVGRTIGFPTANLEVSPRQLVPARGVYAVESTIGKSTYSGVCNIGVRPTFGPGEVSIEVHLMGFRGDIYGQQLDVVFCRRLRDEMAFESPEKLVEQIRQDLESAGSQGFVPG